MTAREVVIHGGRVVTPDGIVDADVTIAGERIAAVGDAQPRGSADVVDAAGCLVVPGGIDVHTHLAEPLDWKFRTADDFYTGTVGAAFGGTTTIIDFAKRHPDKGLYDSWADRCEVARPDAAIDYSFHPMVTSAGLDDGDLDDLRRLAGEGMTSVKLFMAYPGRMMVDDHTILRAMNVAAEEGMIVLLHAENGAMVQDATDQLVAAGRTAEHEHRWAHPDLAETEAIHRAARLAEHAGAPLYVVHVSSGAGAAEVAAARRQGLPVWGETCPQYLARAYEDYAELGYEAAKFICSPPIRERANQDEIWNALATNELSTVATDHAVFHIDESEELGPQKTAGRDYFPKIPNGVPGIEDRMSIVYSGVAEGRYGIERFVDLVSAIPARLFGLYPRKGAIAPGSDADLVVWDPEAEHRPSAETHHIALDYNLYEGMTFPGRARHVFSRGEAIVADDEWRGERGRGKLLARDRVRLDALPEVKVEAREGA